MSKVRVLPEILSNKIAAGEVVERPASVVKELVENSLDAGSRSIEIDIEKGGRSLIQISDDGIGMAGDDAMLAVERYATSKIYEDEDLFTISTLGFRGEALPSIASVSRFNLVTREERSDVATEIAIEGGRVKDVRETAGPVGTRISVAQLFYNTPARRKFLKTIATEMGHIADTVSSIALGWPGVRFLLNHNGKRVKSWPASSDASHRVVDVLGSDLRNNLLEVGIERGGISLSGWISSPAVTRSTSQRIFMYVNGRCIRDRGLQHALFEGYRSRLMKGRFPVAVIFLKIPFDQVDVNVHPSKHEVRFADMKTVYGALRDGVRHALEAADKPALGRGVACGSENAGGVKGSDESFYERMRSSDVKNYSEQALFTSPPPSWSRSGVESATVRDPFEGYGRGASFAGKDSAGWAKQSVPSHTDGGATHFKESGFKAVAADIDTACTEMDSDWEQRGVQPDEEASLSSFFSGLRVVGQLHNSYIICDSGEGLILVDQHAAHERVVFEELRAKGVGSRSQALLIPETVEMGFREAAALSNILSELSKLGLHVEPFGGTTFVIKSVPPLLSEGKMVLLVSDIAEKMVAVGYAGELEDRLEECLILMACHGAIRANQSLGFKEMGHLMAQLDRCCNPSFCPHGRPTWIKWSIGLIEKSFRR